MRGLQALSKQRRLITGSLTLNISSKTREDPNHFLESDAQEQRDTCNHKLLIYISVGDEVSKNFRLQLTCCRRGGCTQRDKEDQGPQSHPGGALTFKMIQQLPIVNNMLLPDALQKFAVQTFRNTDLISVFLVW